MVRRNFTSLSDANFFSLAGAFSMRKVSPQQLAFLHTIAANTFKRTTHRSMTTYIFHIESSVSCYDSLDVHYIYHLTHCTAQLNAARGRLRTIVHRELYKPIKDLLEADCKCKGNTLWGYEENSLMRACGPWRMSGDTPQCKILSSHSKTSPIKSPKILVCAAVPRGTIQ